MFGYMLFILSDVCKTLASAALLVSLYLYWLLLAAIGSHPLVPTGSGQHRPLPPTPNSHSLSAEDTGHYSTLADLLPPAAILPCWV